MKTIQASETIYTELMIPSYANFGGKVHGGIILSIMDKVAYVCACKHSESYVVTVSVDGVEFLSPVEVGNLLTIKACVNYVGNTTMIVGMRVESFNPITSVTTHTNSCYFTMAAKNEDGSLREVQGLHEWVAFLIILVFGVFSVIQLGWTLNSKSKSTFG